MDSVEGFRPSLIEAGKDDLRRVFEMLLPDDLKQRTSRVRTLSVGCGNGIEATPIKDVIQTVDYYGIDIDVNALEVAKAFNPEINEERFKYGNGTDIESYGDDMWDLIILRNPRVAIGDGEVEWGAIFSNVSQKLNDEGYIYLTAPTKAELKTSLRLIHEKGDFDVVLERDIHQMMKSGFPIIDELVAVLKKKGGK